MKNTTTEPAYAATPARRCHITRARAAPHFTCSEWQLRPTAAVRKGWCEKKRLSLPNHRRMIRNACLDHPQALPTHMPTISRWILEGTG